MENWEKEFTEEYDNLCYIKEQDAKACIAAHRKQAIEEERKRILVVVDEKLENYREAAKLGAASQFGSSSGGIMLEGCVSALKHIRSLLTPKS